MPCLSLPRVSPHRILALIPAWNEQDRIAGVIQDLHQNGYDDILAVDDGSTDRTPAVARELGCTVISHAQNFGVGAAIRTGIGFACDQHYDVLIVVNGIGKTPARCIPDLSRPIIEAGYDFVQGSRYLKDGKRPGLPFHRSIGTKVHSALFGLCLRRRVTDGTSGFRAMRVSMLRDPRFRLDQPWLDRYELEPYLYYKCVELGYRVKEVPVEIVYPKSGHYTKMHVLLDWWRITRPLIFLRFGWRK